VWDDDDLTRIRDLHTRSFSDKAEFLGAKHLAEYLGLGPIDQLHMPLPLHIVFIGFQVWRSGVCCCARGGGISREEAGALQE